MNKEEIINLQIELQSLGLYLGKIDGVAGPMTRLAAKNNNILIGDGTWPWVAKIDGDDIVIIGARGTCFGGSRDPQDSGETASGISTKGNPKLKACSLPMNYVGKSRSLLKALGGSPIPKIPFNTNVRVSVGDKHINLPVIDIGPAKYTGNAIDLTIAAARFFDPQATATHFEIHCDVRILGAAKFIK